MHGGLAGRIGAADDENGFSAAGNGFRSATAVVDAGALQTVNAGHIESAPLNTHGEEQGVAGNFGAVGELDEAIGTVHAEADDILRRKNFDAEAAGLRDGAAAKSAPIVRPESRDSFRCGS